MEDPEARTRELHKKYDNVRLGEEVQWLANRAALLQRILYEIEWNALNQLRHYQGLDVINGVEVRRAFDSIASQSRIYRLTSGKVRGGEEDGCRCGHVRFFHGEDMTSFCEVCGPDTGAADRDGHSDEPLCPGFYVVGV